MGVFGKIVDSLAGGAGSIASSAIGAVAGAVQAKKEREFNAEQAEINRQFQTSEREAAQQWNLEQWNRENEYNTPAAQMQRMVEAGINPNQAAQAIGGNATAPGQVRTSGQSGSQASAPGSYAGSLADVIGSSVNSAVQARLGNSQADYQDKVTGRYDEVTDVQIAKTRGEIAKMAKDTELTDATLDRLVQMTPLELQQLNSSIMLAQEDIKLRQEQQETEDIKQELVDAQVNETVERTENIKSERQLLNDEHVIKQAYIAYQNQTGVPIGLQEFEALWYYAEKHDGDISGIAKPIIEMYEGKANVDLSAQKDLNAYNRKGEHYYFNQRAKREYQYAVGMAKTNANLEQGLKQFQSSIDAELMELQNQLDIRKTWLSKPRWMGGF